MNEHDSSGRPPRYSHDIVLDEDARLGDTLSRHYLAKHIAQIIRGMQITGHPSQNADNSRQAHHTYHSHPRVLGIYGSWGAGKSYLLSLIINELFAGNRDDTEPIIICPFKPWEYEAEGNLAIGLVKSLRQIDKAYPGRNPQMANWGRSDAFKKSASQLIKLIAQVLTNSGDIRLELAGGIAKTAAQHLVEEDDIKEIQVVMARLIDQIQRAYQRRGTVGKPHLVVMIDDLDRCNPRHMVMMFEWLKVHLNVPGITYVLALDHVAAAKAIVGAYGDYLGAERDVAYGYRYLEKLVDQEYELEDTHRVEHMAIVDVYGAHQASTRYPNIKAIAREAAGGDFPGIDYLEQLIGLRSLRVPRTMLKIVWRFSESMAAIRASGPEYRGRLPASYPFWTLFLICVNYRLDPETLGDFVDGRSELYRLLAKERGEMQPDAQWRTSPRIEFWKFAEVLRQRGGESLVLPTQTTLQLLATIIRELIGPHSDHASRDEAFTLIASIAEM
jgi:hypothetical protein